MIKLFDAILESNENETLRVKSLKLEVFKTAYPKGGFAMNEAFDAGEALRLMFECIHKHLGDGSTDNCSCPLHPACQQKLIHKIKCSSCGGK